LGSRADLILDIVLKSIKILLGNWIVLQKNVQIRKLLHEITSRIVFPQIMAL